MGDTFRQRIKYWLDEYLEMPEEMIAVDGGVVHNRVKECIKVLIDEGVFTPEEIQNDLLRYDVVFPITRINEMLF